MPGGSTDILHVKHSGPRPPARSPGTPVICDVPPGMEFACALCLGACPRAEGGGEWSGLGEGTSPFLSPMPHLVQGPGGARPGAWVLQRPGGKGGPVLGQGSLERVGVHQRGQLCWAPNRPEPLGGSP